MKNGKLTLAELDAIVRPARRLAALLDKLDAAYQRFLQSEGRCQWQEIVEVVRQILDTEEERTQWLLLPKERETIQ